MPATVARSVAAALLAAAALVAPAASAAVEPACPSDEAASLLQTRVELRQSASHAVEAIGDAHASAASQASLHQEERAASQAALHDERKDKSIFEKIGDYFKMCVQKVETAYKDPLHEESRIVVGGLAQIALGIVIAVIYRMFKVDRVEKEFKGEDAASLNGAFKVSLFGCCDSRAACCTCVFSSCFPAVRWADTMSMAQIMGFWTGFFWLVILGLLAQISLGVSYVIIPLALMYYRQSLRAKFEMENAGTCGSICGDLLTYCLCIPCAITQEARQLEEASAAKHPIISK